ncbi:MAG: DUF6515 family protein [Chthoniobacterales bacterium]
MKIIPSLLAATALSLVTSGCFYYHSDAPARRTVITETTTAPSRATVVTTLPAGYRTRVIQKKTYYYSNGVYYRTHDRGYVVVPAPL